MHYGEVHALFYSSSDHFLSVAIMVRVDSVDRGIGAALDVE
jgi:hypothetical protein